MSAGLYRDQPSMLHRLAPEVKIVGVLAVTVAVVLTPREAFGAFAGHAALLLGVAAAARLPAGWLASRLLIETPFVVLALVLPFVGEGERVTWLGLALSIDGLYGAWNILVKGTLGVLAALLLAGTTTPRDLVVGLQRLRTPTVLVQIALFMLRYLDVIADQARRMRIARLSRGHDPRFLWQLRAYAGSIGVLFLTSYERGERVYLAMVSRGYTGALPVLAGTGRAGSAQWAAVSEGVRLSRSCGSVGCSIEGLLGVFLPRVGGQNANGHSFQPCHKAVALCRDNARHESPGCRAHVRVPGTHRRNGAGVARCAGCHRPGLQQFPARNRAARAPAIPSS